MTGDSSKPTGPDESSKPIGVFDSGVGGLTVAHAIKQVLPDEKLIYFGDTAHLPYGDKSADTIRRYSLEISDFLMEKQCKAIVIACNSASATAYDALVEKYGDKAVILNVIDPVVRHIEKHCGDPGTESKVGIIGTKATINSDTYPKKIRERCSSTEPRSLATPLFVPMIEEGFIFDDISNAIIRTYLSDRVLKDIDSLILGCTHYPIIKNQINKFFSFDVEILDSAMIVAKRIKKVLSKQELLNKGDRLGRDEFYVSDHTDHFEKIARMFFEEKIELQQLSLK